MAAFERHVCCLNPAMRCTALGVVLVTALAGNAFAGPAEQGCSYSVSPLSVSVSGAGGTGQIQVATDAGCAWSASTAVGWLSVSPGNGIGSGTVTWTAAANTLSTQRWSFLTIAGRSVSVAQGQPPPPSAPGAPGQLAASVSGSNVTLTWSPPESGGAPTTYVIAAGSASGWSNLAHFATGSTLTTFTAIDVPPGMYFVRVGAQNATGSGPPSNEVTLTVGQSCTAAPPSALQYTVSGSLVTLTWAPAAGGVAPTSYLVEAGTSVALTDIGTFNTGWPTTTFAAHAPPGVYFVRLRAATPCGVSAPTTDIVIVVQP
jgi:hypothetical protein